MGQLGERMQSDFRNDDVQMHIRFGIQKKLKNFQGLVGETGWARLTEDIRSRFATAAKKAPVYYDGQMRQVSCSPIGWVMAQAARIIGTPLAPFSGKDIPVHVRVFKDKNSNGTVWEREYFFPHRKPIIVRSTKHFTENCYLVECVGGGIGMKLDVFEEDHKLHFKSTEYFWQGVGLTIRLPAIFTPGVAHVVHTDEGNGVFRFTMTIHHRFFGTTFFQDGLFQEEKR